MSWPIHSFKFMFITLQMGQIWTNSYTLASSPRFMIWICPSSAVRLHDSQINPLCLIRQKSKSINNLLIIIWVHSSKFVGGKDHTTRGQWCNKDLEKVREMSTSGNDRFKSTEGQLRGWVWAQVMEEEKFTFQIWVKKTWETRFFLKLEIKKRESEGNEWFLLHVKKVFHFFILQIRINVWSAKPSCCK